MLLFDDHFIDGWLGRRRRGGGQPSRPTITVTGGTITPFSRGADYIEMLWRAGGGFTVSNPVSAQLALGAGGGTGGRSQSANYDGGGGGAGGLIRRVETLPAGEYTVIIGAGGAEIVADTTRNAGADSILTGPGDFAILAAGGGGGAVYGTGLTTGADGGSGGGGRGQPSGNLAAGAGVAGQGHAGGVGYGSSDPAARGSGGGGGAGGPGSDAMAGVPGYGGAGVMLDWIATPREVCRGGDGILGTNTDPSPAADWGSGTRGAYNATVGAAGDGFLFIVVRADQVTVI